MNEPAAAIDSSLGELDKLRKKLKSRKDKQVRSREERALAEATANAWFNSHSPKVRAYSVDLKVVDSLYGTLLKLASNMPLRSKMCASIDSLKTMLVDIKIANAVAFTGPPRGAGEISPDFGKLVKDPNMQQILIRRWAECENCVAVKATLASIVMMGGLLEALFLTRINVAGTASLSGNPKCPKEKGGRIKSLKDWTLWDMIEVADAEKWISVTLKSIGHLLRDYRNWIHPHKELSSGTTLGPDDSQMLWQVVKEMAKQILK